MSARKLITEHLDLWTGAVTHKTSAGRGSNGKVELTGIKKLRELILELAVRGKLVEQDPSDEPASVLLDRIAEEKARLVKDGKIRKPRKLPPLTDANKPFSLPEQWEWTQIEAVGHDWGQKEPDQVFSYIDVSAIDNIKGLINQPEAVSPSSAPSRARKKVRPNTVIYSTVRPYLKNIAVVEDQIDPEPIASTAFAIVSPLAGIPARYLLHYLRSPVFTHYVESVQTGIAYPAINDKQFFSGALPVPPLREQHRIVDKVDELMTLCDRLEQQVGDQLEAHEVLVDTLLDALTRSADAAELAENWGRVAEHFDTLFTTEASIDKLKQTILQLAVMGRVVPQDTGNESTKDVFERVYRVGGSGRNRLISSMRIDSNIQLPHGWDFAVLPEVTEGKKYSIKRGPFGSALKKAFFKSSGFKVYEQQHAINDDFSRGDYYIGEEKFNELRAFEVQPGDLIISCSGTVGRVAEAPRWMEPGVINQALLKLTLDQRLMSNDYFKILFPAFFLKTETLQNLQGTAQKNMVSMETLKKEPFPMPPIVEQQRIVEKVDELMALCDHLKARLGEAGETRAHLAEAVVEQAV